MINCTFNAVHERDMDLLFLEALVSDIGFANLVLSKTRFCNKEFQVLRATLSETETDLGETDICVILQIEDIRVGLLVEDKIDAIAMPEQSLRYHKRAEKSILKGKFDAYEVFIFCPQKYYENNAEAKKYDHFLSYEEIKNYFDSKNDVISTVRSQQLAQAIDRAKKPPEVNVGEAANLFFNKYKAYQKEYYPDLDLRTSDKSNGWWPHYSTKLGDVYLYHKRPEGFVDLTFPNAAEKMDALQAMASWLRNHDVPNVVAVKTGKAAALRIEVPKMPLKAIFENIDPLDVKKAFDAIQALVDFANLIEDAHCISAIKTKKNK